MKQNLIILLCFAFFSIHAQEKVPTLKGKVNISIKQGTMDCDFTLTDIPKIADYYIRINTGMNIRYIRNIEDKYSFRFEKDYNDTTRYESFGYYIPASGTGKVIRDGYRFSYTGKFPVIKDTLTAQDNGDWKGNIAFNGYSVRTDGSQSAWYPVFYDKATDKMYDKVKYDLEITCSDCSVIYLNGNAPVQAKKAHFKSDAPTSLMMYAGNFKVVNDNGTYFLNPDLTPAQMKEFGAMTKKFKDFYEQKLGIPYKDKITYIQTTPVTKYNAWLFVSYPTIVNIGWGKYAMKALFDKKTGDWFRPYMAHELGHYYFGAYRTFNSELGDMIGEGFAEYLSMKISKEYFSDSLYTAKVAEKIKDLKDFKPTPFSDIKKESDYKNREIYVYSYAPMIFMAIEREIGADNMWKWLNNILTTKSEFTNYDFLSASLSATIKDNKKAQAIRDKYFTTDATLDNAIATIQKK